MSSNTNTQQLEGRVDKNAMMHWFLTNREVWTIGVESRKFLPKTQMLEAKFRKGGGVDGGGINISMKNEVFNITEWRKRIIKAWIDNKKQPDPTIPTYKEIEKRMIAYCDDEKNPERFRGNVFKWMAEFGESHYEGMCKILTALRNREPDTNRIVREAGENMGDMTAMQANFYICTNFMIDPSEHDQCYHSIIEEMWDGINEWRY